MNIVLLSRHDSIHLIIFEHVAFQKYVFDALTTLYFI